MKRTLSTITFLLLAATALSSMAQVYKWVDADGNVHFSDNPQDAERAQQVSVETVNVMEGGDELAASASQNRERVIAQQSKAAEAAKNAPDLCADAVEKYRALTEVQYDSNGKPFYYYMDNEDGSPMSDAEHQRRIEELGNNLRRRGCI